ncbi:hypothetical protein GPECTOR_177g229 [Gonium pectorale]|uniref:14-3-3 domain-containing protein n=1 Tax=Gonium pectorale TaxID=33097 RepID=A0A150FX84_GONPE|nr:hypothetical protein GPECTOR_177g229 [Gonium pectorale]|eukprot:KXZ42234.1 hypothetical protein GPECTOR_177g229 [Gonium pectorale]
MRKVAVLAKEQELSADERKLLQLSYEGLVLPRRNSRAILQDLEQEEGAKEQRVAIIKKQRGVVEGELDELCQIMLHLIDTHLLPSASTTEASAFYLTMKGDSHRYLAEYKVDEARQTAVNQAMAAYTSAEEKACHLPPTSHTRLCLALNHSVFCYHIVKEPSLACFMAMLAYAMAVGTLDNHAVGDDYEATMLVIQRLKDNITHWTLEMNGNGETQS